MYKIKLSAGNFSTFWDVFHENSNLEEQKIQQNACKIYNKIKTEWKAYNNKQKNNKFTFGSKNSPGNSTSAVLIEKLLKKRHFSSIKKDLQRSKNESLCEKYFYFSAE